MLDELLWCEIAQGLVRADSIVDGFPYPEVLGSRWTSLTSTLQVAYLI
jgi:hypothetical protein